MCDSAAKGLGYIAKAGNPKAVVGFSSNRGPTVSPFSELAVTDGGSELRCLFRRRALAPAMAGQARLKELDKPNEPNEPDKPNELNELDKPNEPNEPNPAAAGQARLNGLTG